MSSMRKCVGVAAAACVLSALSSGALAQDKAKDNSPLNPAARPVVPGAGAALMPTNLSCMVKIADASGKAYNVPILSSQFLPKAFVYYQITNGSNLTAIGISIKVTASPNGGKDGTTFKPVLQPPDTINYVPANKSLLELFYTIAYPKQPNVTLAKMQSTAWIKAGSLDFHPINSSQWAKDFPNTSASLLGTVDVTFLSPNIKGCSTKFAVNWVDSDIPK